MALRQRFLPVRMRPGKGILYSFRQKFLFAFLGLVLSLSVGLLVLVENRQRRVIVQEMEKRGLTIASHLAAVSTNALLTYNFVTLEQAVEKVGQHQDILYAIILDREGRVGAYSQRDELVGTFLIDEVSQRAAVATAPLIQRIRKRNGQEAYNDIAIPVFVTDRQQEQSKWGTVRIGLSLQSMHKEILHTRLQVLLLGVLGIVLGTVAAALLARRISAPISALVEGTLAVARGELSYTIPIHTRDEIAVLASNFNQMTRELLKHRTELEQTNLQLDQGVRELATLARYNENIIESMTSGLLTLDSEGRIATFNNTAEVITGFEGVLVRGQSYRKMFESNPQILSILEAAREHNTPLTVPHLELRRVDGTPIPIALRTAMLHDNEGYVVGLLVIFEDLSPLQALERQLQRADRLAALGQMAAGVAHEIKNPLASIRTFVQLVQRKHHDERFLSKFNRIVPQELDRINFIIEEMLELARPTQLHLTALLLPPLLQRVLEVYAERLQQQQITVKTTFSQALPTVMADAEQLYRCFTNLVLNGIEAMASHGELSLSCRPVPRVLVDVASVGQPEPTPALPAERLRVDLCATDVEIIVQDTGAGIPAEQLDYVFTPFWTTKPKGTGLGLALSHKIIEEHHGRIQIASEVGQGTAVTVLLPAIPASDGAVA